RWLMLRRGRLLSYALIGFGLTAIAAALLIVASWYEGRPHRHPLVVIAREELLRKGNGRSYPRREGSAELRPGVEAWPLCRREGGVEVERSGGEVGWVPADAALVDDTP